MRSQAAQFSDSEDKKDDYREQESDFVLASLMLAKSWQRLGREDMAHQQFDRVVQLRSDLRVLADEKLNGESNLLLVVDFGYGPKKFTHGSDGAFVGFVRRPIARGLFPGRRS